MAVTRINSTHKKNYTKLFMRHWDQNLLSLYTKLSMRYWDENLYSDYFFILTPPLHNFIWDILDQNLYYDEANTIPGVTER